MIKLILKDFTNVAILTKEKESKNTTHIPFSSLDKNFVCKLYLFWVSRQPPNQVTDFFFIISVQTKKFLPIQQGEHPVCWIKRAENKLPGHFDPKKAYMSDTTEYVSN